MKQRHNEGNGSGQSCLRKSDNDHEEDLHGVLQKKRANI